MKESIYRVCMSLSKTQIIEFGITFGVYADTQGNRKALIKGHTKDQLAWHVAHTIWMYHTNGILDKQIESMQAYKARLQEMGLE